MSATLGLQITLNPTLSPKVKRGDTVTSPWYFCENTFRTELPYKVGISPNWESMVARIRTEMMRVIERSDAPHKDFDGFTNYLRTDKRFYFDKKEDLLRGYRDVAKRVSLEIGDPADMAADGALHVRAPRAAAAAAAARLSARARGACAGAASRSEGSASSGAPTGYSTSRPA